MRVKYEITPSGSLIVFQLHHGPMDSAVRVSHIFPNLALNRV